MPQIIHQIITEPRERARYCAKYWVKVCEHGVFWDVTGRDDPEADRSWSDQHHHQDDYFMLWEHGSPPSVADDALRLHSWYPMWFPPKTLLTT